MIFYFNLKQNTLSYKRFFSFILFLFLFLYKSQIVSFNNEEIHVVGEAHKLSIENESDDKFSILGNANLVEITKIVSKQTNKYKILNTSFSQDIYLKNTNILLPKIIISKYLCKENDTNSNYFTSHSQNTNKGIFVSNTKGSNLHKEDYIRKIEGIFISKSILLKLTLCKTFKNTYSFRGYQPPPFFII